MFFKKKKKENFILKRIKKIDKFVTNLVIGNALGRIFNRKKTEPLPLIILKKIGKKTIYYSGKITLFGIHAYEFVKNKIFKTKK